MSKKRPNGYWQNRSYLEREFRRIAGEMGRFPTTTELDDMGYSNIVRAAVVYHGGVNAVRESLGYDKPVDKRTRESLWPDFKKWEQYGVNNGFDKKSPTEINDSKKKKDRVWFKKGQRAGWISDFDFKRKRIEGQWKDAQTWISDGNARGYDSKGPKELADSKDKYERSWYNKGQRKDWVKDFNFNRQCVPVTWQTQESWKQYGVDRGYEDRVCHTLRKSKDFQERSWLTKGEREKWIDHFQFAEREPSNRLWTEDKVAEECRRVVEKKGYLPSNGELIKLGLAPLASAIPKHGGYPYFRKKLGLKQVSKLSGYWQDWKNVQIELKEVIGKLGHFPTAVELSQLKKHSLAIALHKYHKGIFAVRARMGYKESQRAHGTLSTMQDGELIEYVRQHYGGKTLKEMRSLDGSLLGVLYKRNLVREIVELGLVTARGIASGGNSLLEQYVGETI